MYLFIYHKRDVSIYRLVKYNHHEVGYINSYGWKLVFVGYYHKKRFVSKSTYFQYIHKENEKYYKRLKLKTFLSKIFNENI